MMYDELIKRLRETSIDFGESDHVSVMLIEAADAIEDLIVALTASNEVIAKSKQQWISVTERLPGKYERVLCINGHCFYMVGFLSYVSFVEGHDYIGEDDYRYMSNVTHWIPLPEPPKDGEE